MTRRKPRPAAMTSAPRHRPAVGAGIDWRKKLVFSLFTVVLVFALIEGLLAAIGVHSRHYVDDPMVGFSNYTPLFVPSTGDSTQLETAAGKLRWFNAQRFSQRKPSGTYRVFCLGGSTTYGHPYDDRTSFCGWMRALLPAADASRHWELINAGGISYASYRVARVMEELVDYEPDLFIVYTGHNEFLEQRTYGQWNDSPFRHVDDWLSRSRSYSMLHRWMRPARPANRTVGEQRELLPAEVKTVLNDGIGPKAFQRDDAQAQNIVRHFAANLERLHAISRSVGARLIVVTPASKLADCAPFKSQSREPLDFAREGQVRRYLQAAEEAGAAGTWQQALEPCDAALRLDPRYARAHYLRGRALVQLQRFDEAREAFVRARDEDVCPLRATSAMEQAVREFASRSQVDLVDFVGKVASLSPHGIPGEQLFLDHVHPTIAGNRLLALQMIELLASRDVVTTGPSWGDAAIARVAEQVESQLDTESHGIALRNLSKVLGWAGQQEEANRLALRAAAAVGSDADTQYMAANALLASGRTVEAIDAYRQALAREPNYLEAINGLGAALQQLGKLDEAVELHRRAIRLRADFAPSYNNLALALQGLKRTAEAQQNYLHAIQLNPRDAKARNNLALLYLHQNRLDDANAQLVEAVSISPEFVEGYFNLARVRQRQQRPNDAVESFRRALQLDPKYLPARAELGVLLANQGNDLEAAEHLRAAASGTTRPTLGVADTLAWLLATSPLDEVRNGPEALRWAQSCVDRTGARSSRSLSTLAAAHAELGDLAAAIRWQAEAVKFAADTERELHLARLNLLRSGKSMRRNAQNQSPR